MDTAKYTAKLYIGSEEILEKTGNNIDELYEWMLVEAQGRLGDWHGEVVETKSQKIIKQFRKSPPD